MKKVVIVARNFLIAGAENMISQLVSNLDQTKFDITLIVTTKKYNNFLEDNIEKSGVKTIYLGKKYTKKIDISKFITFFKMWKVLKKIKPEVIHTHLSAAIYAFPYVLFHNTKLIHTVHNLPEKDIPKITRLFLKLLIKLKKAVPVAISHILAEKIAMYYNIAQETVPIVYNPVDLSKYNDLNLKNENDKYFWLCNVGRLTPQKNHKMLIEAFSIARKKNSNLRLLIVGDGELREELENQVVQKQLKSSIQFLGTRSDIPNILSNVDAFVLTSKFEGLPLSLLEAMAAGLPVIATKVGGVPDIINHNRNGILVESNDIKGFAEAILKLVNNKNLIDEIRKNNINDVKKFDVKTMVRKYEDLYENIIK